MPTRKKAIRGVVQGYTGTQLRDDLATLASMVPPLIIDRLRVKKAERHPALERLGIARDQAISGE